MGLEGRHPYCGYKYIVDTHELSADKPKVLSVAASNPEGKNVHYVYVMTKD